MAVKKTSAGLKGAAEFKGARKILSKLKRAGMIPKGVRLEGGPATKAAPKRKRRRNSIIKVGHMDVFTGTRGKTHPIQEVRNPLFFRKKAKPKKHAVTATVDKDGRVIIKSKVKNPRPRLKRNVAGFVDAEGRFHPVRGSGAGGTSSGRKAGAAYSRTRAGEKPVKKLGKSTGARTIKHSASAQRAATSRRRPAGKKAAAPASFGQRMAALRRKKARAAKK